ncbi:MAG: hypothetical protein ABIH46_10470 [Chloroflexota bacterium]
MVTAYKWEGLPSLSPPYAYSYVIAFRDYDTDTWVYEAPRFPQHIYRVALTTDRNALVLVLLQRHTSLASYLAGDPPERRYAELRDYQNVEIVFTNGIRSEEGYCYSVGFAEWSGLDFNAAVEENKISEEVIYG